LSFLFRARRLDDWGARSWRLIFVHVAHLCAQLLRNSIGIDAVADDLRPNEDDQLGSLHIAGIAGKQLTDTRDLIESWNALAAAILAFADQSAEQYGLAAGNSDRASHLAL